MVWNSRAGPRPGASKVQSRRGTKVQLHRLMCKGSIAQSHVHQTNRPCCLDRAVSSPPPSFFIRTQLHQCTNRGSTYPHPLTGVCRLKGRCPPTNERREFPIPPCELSLPFHPPGHTPPRRIVVHFLGLVAKRRSGLDAARQFGNEA